MTIERAFFRKKHEAEATRIVVDDTGRSAIGPQKMKHDMVMRTQLGALMMEFAGRAAVIISLDAKRTRHAKMADDG